MFEAQFRAKMVLMVVWVDLGHLAKLEPMRVGVPVVDVSEKEIAEALGPNFRNLW